MVFHRHFVQRNDFEILEWSPTGWGQKIYRSMPNRIRNTRLHNILALLLQTTWFRLSYREFRNIKEFGAKSVVTLAHGPEAWMARKVARKLRLPLVVFFHDWWPYLLQLHYGAPLWQRRMIERQFQRLYQECDLALCISEGMLSALGPQPHARVLYPIRDRTLVGSPVKAYTSAETLTILYAGNMSAGYGRQIRRLEQALRGHTQIRLVLIGNTEDWPDGASEELQRGGVLLNKWLPAEEWISHLRAADLFLVNLGFDIDPPEFTRTSFPSKLASYSGFAKPVVFWGPEQSTVIQFGRTHKMPLCCADKKPEEVVRLLERFASDAAYRKECEAAAGRLVGIFDPDKIHGQLLEAIQSIYEK